MKVLKSIAGKLSAINKYRYKLSLVIAVTWTVVDTLYTIIRYNFLDIQSRYLFFEYNDFKSVFLREMVIFMMSYGIGYVLVFNFKRNSRNLPLWFNFLAKTAVLVSLAFLMNFLIHFTYSILISRLSPQYAFTDFIHDTFNTDRKSVV